MLSGFPVAFRPTVAPSKCIRTLRNSQTRFKCTRGWPGHVGDVKKMLLTIKRGHLIIGYRRHRGHEAHVANTAGDAGSSPVRRPLKRDVVLLNSVRVGAAGNPQPKQEIGRFPTLHNHYRRSRCATMENVK